MDELEDPWKNNCTRTPMDLNNVKLLIGSVTETISRTFVLGNEAYSKALLLLNTLVYSIEYAMKQLENGDTKYEAKVRTLKQSLIKLQYECESICKYKEQYKFVPENKKPGCDTLPACTASDDLVKPDLLIALGTFTKDMFTLDSDVDKMIIQSVEVPPNSNSSVYYGGTGLTGGEELVGKQGSTFIPFSNIENLYYSITDSQDGLNPNPYALRITFLLSKAGTNEYTTEVCEMRVDF
tara:strand:+ start:3224 stop:3937 length:714 start_codon:yes stop_codon:yes gene_type:complete